MRVGLLELRYLLDAAVVPPEVGFAIGRRVGPAVVRNRLRRRLRAVLRDLAEPSDGTVGATVTTSSSGSPAAVTTDVAEGSGLATGAGRVPVAAGPGAAGGSPAPDGSSGVPAESLLRGGHYLVRAFPRAATADSSRLRADVTKALERIRRRVERS